MSKKYNEESLVESPPSSPSDSDSPKSEDGLTTKEIAKIASKSFGYVQRSIELLGRESTRLAGARDFSNTLHWTQAMKFLKERGFIYTKTGHGTSVAEQYGNLGGLEKAFQEQFQLENFPLPRLSKTHMEKMEPKNIFDDASKAMLQAHYDMSMQPASFNPPMYVAPKVASAGYAMVPAPAYSAAPVYRNPMAPLATSMGYQPPMMPHYAPMASYPSHLPPTTLQSPSNDMILTPIATRPISNENMSSGDSPLQPRRVSFDAPPQVPLPTDIAHQTKPPTVHVNQTNTGVSLPSIAKLTSTLPEDKPPLSDYPTTNTSSTNTIQSIIHVPAKTENEDNASQLAHEALQTLRQKAADAMLLHNFYESVSTLTEDQKKRSLPPPSAFVGQGHKDKKAKTNGTQPKKL